MAGARVVASDLPDYREVSAMSGGGFNLVAHEAPIELVAGTLATALRVGRLGRRCMGHPRVGLGRTVVPRVLHEVRGAVTIVGELLTG